MRIPRFPAASALRLKVLLSFIKPAATSTKSSVRAMICQRASLRAKSARSRVNHDSLVDRLGSQWRSRTSCLVTGLSFLILVLVRWISAMTQCDSRLMKQSDFIQQLRGRADA